MTYIAFLLFFLVIPVLILLVLTIRDRRRGKFIDGFLGERAGWLAIGLHVLLAILYTTPWDNYLVATRVWFYNPNLVSGVILGWVPLEEYLFFILETICVGLWWLVLIRRLKVDDEFHSSRKIRIISTLILAGLWLAMVGILVSGWKPLTYLGLILAWALPVIIIQLAFGADILWHFRKIVLMVILPFFVYISTADALAIFTGTWLIDPGQSTGIFIGPLPVEEAVFFLVTAIMIGFGLTLSVARASLERGQTWIGMIANWQARISSPKVKVPTPPPAS